MAKVIVLMSSLLMMMMIAVVSLIDGIHCEKDNLEVFTYYAHDIRSGAGKAVYEVAKSSITLTSATSFGQVLVVDEKLTSDPYDNLKQIGRLQGLMTSADLTTSGLAINLNFYFTEGEYKGSTLCILGRLTEKAAGFIEYPVVGGIGKFRFAKEYVLNL